MASREHIFLAVEGDPDDVASWIASLLHMTVEHDDLGNVYVFRPGYDHPGEIGGQVRRNVVAEPDPEPGEESLTDDFTALLDVHHTGRDAEIQRAEAKSLFADLAARSPLPAALLAGFETVIGVTSGVEGAVWLPPGTTPEFPDRAVWGPYRASR